MSGEGKPGSPHVRHDYSILRTERAKGCVFQLVGLGRTVSMFQLAGNGEVWKGAGTTQGFILVSAIVDVRPEASELLCDEGCRLCRTG